MPDPSMVPPHPDPDEDWFTSDPVLEDLLATYVDDETLEAARTRLAELGEDAPQRLDALARTADRHRPELHRRDPTGERVDRIEFHPAYGELQAAAREHQVFTLGWHPLGDRARAPRTVGFALGYLYAQAESGYYCPACMTDGAAFVIDRHGDDRLSERYLDRLISRPAGDLAAAEGGPIEGAMYLTEKRGGSDVGGATRTRAEPTEEEGWRLTGEKWFASNCSADLALVLARMPGTDASDGTSALGLFAVPRVLPDGTRNRGLKIERLKDKLGVTSMPTGEVVLDGAIGYLVAGEGAGFKAMAEMVNLSRLYNAVASVACARRALREGQRAGRTREAFGKELREHPLFARKLVELTVDIEGALAFVMDTAEVFDAWAAGDEASRPVLRALTPCAKAVTGKLAVSAASEGCELIGGNGYIEEYVTPRILRDAQVLPIWEGTTNIQALDLLRAMGKEGALEALGRHTQARLSEADGHAGTKRARERAKQALEAIEQEANRLASADRASMEIAALDLLETVYHTHVSSLLCRLAASTGKQRYSVLADLYATRHLSEDRSEAKQAVQEATLEHGQLIAYPDEA